MAIFDFSKWQPPTILDLSKLKILTFDKRLNMRHHTKFRGNRSNCCWDVVDFSIFHNGGRHLRFAMHTFGPRTKGIRWSLLLCTIWLQSMQQFRKYASFNILQVWLKVMPSFGRFLGILTINVKVYFGYPKRHEWFQTHVVWAVKR